ncbi:MAG TPA: pyrroline-5-carboxylate reductase [Capillimicrobium sp.]|jgi:pyrroline-5-carboxylate reductase
MLGIIGAGNMAGALARGWGDPVLASDRGSGRAAALVAEVGGEALRGNAEVAERADAILLGHKPYQVQPIAREIEAHTAGKTVISVLGGVTVDQLQALYPQAAVVRTMPNTPVAIRQGVTCIAEGGESAVELFERVGKVFVLPEAQIDAASTAMGVTPAYLALVAEALVDAAVYAGVPADKASGMVAQTMAGTAGLLLERDGDTLGVRREVTSPGGSTARGLQALDAAGLRQAFQDAAQAVLKR